MTITRNGVSMTFEQLHQKTAAKQSLKQNNLNTVAVVNGWKLQRDFVFEPWSFFTPGDNGKLADEENTRCIRADEESWQEPLIWARDTEAALEAHRQHPDLIAEIVRPRIWCGQHNDPLASTVPEEWRLEFFDLIRRTPMLDWLLVTKHPRKMHDYFIQDRDLWQPPAPNIWLGARVENQKAADELIPALLSVGVAKRFLHCEPLLGPIDLRDWLGECCRFCTGNNGSYCISCGYSGFRVPPVWQRENLARRPVSLDWVVVGGGRGYHAQRMHPGWARSLRDQCHHPNVPFFFRNSGSVLLAEWVSDSEDDTWLGGIPEDLRVRQYP